MEWLKKWWFLVLFGIAVVGFFVKHETEKKEMQIALTELKEDMNQMPKRVLNEWKAYLFEKKMEAMNIERDTAGSTIDINN